MCNKTDAMLKSHGNADKIYCVKCSSVLSYNYFIIKHCTVQNKKKMIEMTIHSFYNYSVMKQ